MSIYKIAGLSVDMNPRFSETMTWYEPYFSENEGRADITLIAPDDKIKYYVENGLDFTEGIAENNVLGESFNTELIRFNGGYLHSSALLLGDRVYLFSASSGVGKSTLTSRIIKYCPEAVIINDDKPSFRLVDGKCIVYGTPFAGGTAVNKNLSAELGAIVFIERSSSAVLSKEDSKFAITNILRQTTRNTNPVCSAKLLDLFSEILEKYPVYSLKCPNDDSPVIPLLEMMNYNSNC